jgi:pSer/pThr/pTyr-binding forkhead associated (FHA) protein
MYKLRHSNSNKGIWLIGDKLSIGSASSNGIAISGSGVADHHADLLINGETITLCPIAGCDTTVNGTKVITSRDLQLGDIVSFANVGMELILPKQQASSDAGKPVPKKILKPKVSADETWRIIGATKQTKSIFGTMVVGRSPDCDITFSYERLSRRHAQFHESDGVLWITDLDSANGTFVNGKRLTAVERLNDGDKIAFEKLKFSVKAPIKINAAVVNADDDVGKTVVGSAIDSEAIKKAQAELVERKRIKDAEQKKAAQETLLSQAKLRSEPATGRSNVMIIMLAVAAIAVTAVAAVLLI